MNAELGFCQPPIFGSIMRVDLGFRQPNTLPIFDPGSLHAYQLVGDYVAGPICVKNGFIMDLASIPRILWFIYLPDGIHRAAALVHDWLYANKGKNEVGDKVVRLSRKECDDIFYQLMVDAGVPKFRANIMWTGVRVGGKLPWYRSSGTPRIEELRYQI